MPIEEAVVALARVRELPVSAIADLVTTDVEGRTFYATAPMRVGKQQLDELRESVVALAVRHGFPAERDARATPSFDQELAVLFATGVPMLPVEASDEKVWDFVTLRVLPDVAAWRWPSDPTGVDHSEDDDGGGVPTKRADRLRGGRRGVIRQAWWRGYLLGPEACLVLDEDNFNNLTDRVSLIGYPTIRELAVAAHIARLSNPNYDRRHALRRALVLIGREFGRIAVEALPREQIAEVVNAAFDRAADETAKTLRPDQSGGRAGSVETPLTTDTGGRYRASERFLNLAAAYRDVLEPALIAVDLPAARDLLEQAAMHVHALARDPLALRIFLDLSVLVEDWASLIDQERMVAHAALWYFIEDDDARLDSEVGGLLDDDEVTTLAFIAIGRERPPS
jgi:hypothetical protein